MRSLLNADGSLRDGLCICCGLTLRLHFDLHNRKRDCAYAGEIAATVAATKRRAQTRRAQPQQPVRALRLAHQSSNRHREVGI